MGGEERGEREEELREGKRRGGWTVEEGEAGRKGRDEGKGWGGEGSWCPTNMICLRHAPVSIAAADQTPVCENSHRYIFAHLFACAIAFFSEIQTVQCTITRHTVQYNTIARRLRCFFFND